MPVVGIAASAGGPAALAVILRAIAALEAPVLVVQHLDPRFVDGFRDWMERVSALPVEMAEDDTRLRRGVVYLAPHGLHLKLGNGGRTVLDAEPARLHTPSADELFLSMASNAGSRGIGVVLTGMGDDGAVGLRALHLAGGNTLVQDRASSAVYGMPSAAGRLEAADREVPLDHMAAAIRAAVRARA